MAVSFTRWVTRPRQGCQRNLILYVVYGIPYEFVTIFFWIYQIFLNEAPKILEIHTNLEGWQRWTTVIVHARSDKQ